MHFEPEHPKMGHLVAAAAEKSRTLLEEVRRHRPARPFPKPVPPELVDVDRNAPWHNSLFLRACRGEPTPRTPIWLMRQAGRYMAEYRSVRSEVSFLELCKNPSLCTEVMLTAVDKLGVDAAIIFSDLLPILEPLGFKLEFSAGDGPVIHNPIRTLSDIDRIPHLTDLSSLDFVFETVRQTRKALSPGLPLIGFAGAPFTLASYAIEGGGSRNYAQTKKLMYAEPVAWKKLMERLAITVVDYLNAQIGAGAQCVQLFDSWVGCLDPEDYRHYVLPHMHRILEGIAPSVPVINFGAGNPELLPLLRGDRRTVVGVDWRIPLDEAWQRIGHQRPVQGNLDPTVLLGPIELIRQRAAEILRSVREHPGHIFNLGHGILPQTPVENVVALVKAVKE
jgi:uroporphyrinogen decarboxylase